MKLTPKRDIITMYRKMINQTELLRDAFSKFRDKENDVKDWHRKFHKGQFTNSRGKGRWAAMMTMQTAMAESCGQYGLANQDKIHITFEAFVVWGLKRSDTRLVMAIMNMLNYMGEFWTLVNEIPFEKVPKKIVSEWDILFMQELRVTIAADAAKGDAGGDVSGRAHPTASNRCGVSSSSDGPAKTHKRDARKGDGGGDVQARG